MIIKDEEYFCDDFKRLYCFYAFIKAFLIAAYSWIWALATIIVTISFLRSKVKPQTVVVFNLLFYPILILSLFGLLEILPKKYPSTGDINYVQIFILICALPILESLPFFIRLTRTKVLFVLLLTLFVLHTHQVSNRFNTTHYLGITEGVKQDILQGNSPALPYRGDQRVPKN